MSDAVLPSGWTVRERDDYAYPHSSMRRFNFRYEREDGAAVFENADEYWAKPWLENHRRWSASAPDGGLLTFQHYNSRLGTTRRWKTPDAAMKAVDREFPRVPHLVSPYPETPEKRSE